MSCISVPILSSPEVGRLSIVCFTASSSLQRMQTPPLKSMTKNCCPKVISSKNNPFLLHWKCTFRVRDFTPHCRRFSCRVIRSTQRPWPRLSKDNLSSYSLPAYRAVFCFGTKQNYNVSVTTSNSILRAHMCRLRNCIGSTQENLCQVNQRSRSILLSCCLI